MAGERRRGERHWDGAEAAGTLKHARILQRDNNRAVELGDDLRRRAGRGDEAEPADRFVSGQTGFVESGVN